MFKIKIKKNLREILKDSVVFKFNGKNYKYDKVPLEDEDKLDGLEFRGFYRLNDFKNIIDQTVKDIASLSNVSIPLSDCSIPSVSDNNEEYANIFTRLIDFPGIQAILKKLAE